MHSHDEVSRLLPPGQTNEVSQMHPHVFVSNVNIGGQVDGGLRHSHLQEKLL